MVILGEKSEPQIRVFSSPDSLRNRSSFSSKLNYMQGFTAIRMVWKSWGVVEEIFGFLPKILQIIEIFKKYFQSGVTPVAELALHIMSYDQLEILYRMISVSDGVVGQKNFLNIPQSSPAKSHSHPQTLTHHPHPRRRTTDCLLSINE